jgi:hypothetical protein
MARLSATAFGRHSRNQHSPSPPSIFLTTMAIVDASTLAFFECCYALQDKVWVEDPDGNSWEIFVVKGDAPVMQKQTMAAGCCVPKIEGEPGTKASGGCCV